MCGGCAALLKVLASTAQARGSCVLNQAQRLHPRTHQHPASQRLSFSFLSTCLFFLFFSDSAMCMVKSTAYDARDDRRATEGTGSKCALNQQCSKSSTGFVFHPQTSHQCYRSSYCLLMHWTASPEKLVVKNQDVAREALDILRQHFVLECPVSVQGCQTHKFAAQNLQKPQPHVQISHKYLFTDGRMGWK